MGDIYPPLRVRQSNGLRSSGVTAAGEPSLLIVITVGLFRNDRTKAFDQSGTPLQNHYESFPKASGLTVVRFQTHLPTWGRSEWRPGHQLSTRSTIEP